MTRSLPAIYMLLVGLWFTHLLPAEFCTRAGAQEASPDADITRYIPDDALAAVVVSPREWLTSPMLEMFPLEIMQVQMKEEFGIDPFDIQQIKSVVSLDPATMQPAFGSITTLTGEMDFTLVRAGFHARDEMIQVGGHETYPVNGPPGTVLAMIDKNTLFYGTANLLPVMLDASQGTGKLPATLRTMSDDSGVNVVVVMDQIRPIVSQAAMQSANNLAPDLQPITQIPGLTDALKIHVDFHDNNASVQVVLVGTDEVAAQRIESILVDSIAVARELAIAEINRSLAHSAPSDAMRQATNQYANRVADTITQALQPTRDGDEVTIDAQSGISIATTGMFVGLLLPAVQAARTAARRMSMSNNMKQVMLALHNYHDAYNRLPPAAITDPEGKPLLSWRVAILPFVEEQELYQKFHLDEPWDSEHNLPLSKELPGVYRSPNTATIDGKTVLQGVVGDDIGMKPLERTQFRDFIDGLSNSIMILQVDADAAVVWSKPEDLEIDMDNPLEHLGNAERGGFHIGMGDGSVRFMTQDIDPELFKKMLTRAGQEVIEFP